MKNIWVTMAVAIGGLVATAYLHAAYQHRFTHAAATFQLKAELLTVFWILVLPLVGFGALLNLTLGRRSLSPNWVLVITTVLVFGLLIVIASPFGIVYLGIGGPLGVFVGNTDLLWMSAFLMGYLLVEALGKTKQ